MNAEKRGVRVGHQIGYLEEGRMHIIAASPSETLLIAPTPEVCVSNAIGNMNQPSLSKANSVTGD